MHKRPLAVIAVFFILGIVLARFLPESLRFVHIFIATLIFILLCLLLSSTSCRPGLNLAYSGWVAGRGKLANVFLLLSITSFASLLYINSNIWPDNHISHFLGDEKLKTSVMGTIKSPALTRRPYYGKINSMYLFEIEGIKDKGEWWGVKGLSQIRIQAEKDYRYGDRLLVRGTIKKPGRPVIASRRAGLNLPYGYGRAGSAATDVRKFNYREYLERQNIFAIVNTKESNITVLAHNYKSNPILKYTYIIREKLKNQIIDKMPLDSGAFLRAILLGDRSELPKDIQNSFKNSGTMHIFPIQNTKNYNYPLNSFITL